MIDAGSIIGNNVFIGIEAATKGEIKPYERIM